MVTYLSGIITRLLMTDYGRYTNKVVAVKPNTNRAKEKRKKVLEEVRKRRAMALKNRKG